MAPWLQSENRLDSEVEVIRIAGYSCMILTSCLMGKF